MKYRFVNLLLLVCIATNVYAGDFNHNVARYANRTTVADPAEDNYDVKYVKLDLQIADTSLDIIGNVTTTAQVIAGNMDTYVFELDSAFTIDSVLINGSSLPVQTDSFVRKVILPISMQQYNMFTAEIFYHGTAPDAGTFYTMGITHTVSNGVNMIYTVSEPYGAKDWWPCKQSLRDKIDSADIWVTVPDGQKAGSNGLLQEVVTPATGYKQYRWKTRYAIDYYLVSIAVAPYSDYSYYMHFSNSTDSMLIQNYFYDSVSFISFQKAYLDSMGLIIDYFSRLFGRYPFYKEKYGHCFTSLAGGEENQTMTTIGPNFTLPVYAHELGHQWFGDNVTCSTWQDIWLNEGFATYIEQLFIEHFHSEAEMKNYRSQQYQQAMGNSRNYTIAADTLNVFDSLLSWRDVYLRGGGVVHMLRYIASNDSLFFSALKIYQQLYGSGNASSENLQAVFEQVYNSNLDYFFNEWVYGCGYPFYNLRWNQSGSQKFIHISQLSSDPASVAVFTMPLKLELVSASSDTIVLVYNDQSQQDYTVTWSDSIEHVIVDPNDDIINAGSIQYDPTLEVSNVIMQGLSVYPNPTHNDWYVNHLKDGGNMQLTDMEGRVLWQADKVHSTQVIPGLQLSTGAYLLRILSPGGDREIIKLAHW